MTTKLPKKTRRKKSPAPAAPPEPKSPRYVWVDVTSRSQSNMRKEPDRWTLENLSARGFQNPRMTLHRPRESEAAFTLESQFSKLYRSFSLNADYELAGRDREAIERASEHALLLIEQALLNDLDLIREIRAAKPTIQARNGWSPSGT